MNTVVDAHQYFWTYGTYQTSWMEVPPYAGDAGDADHWTAADIAPYIDRALEVFGPERLMLGSDWPVANLRGGYSKVWRETTRALAGLSRGERDRILGGTAIAFYRLPGLWKNGDAQGPSC